jgi:hypothetical protein
MTPEAELSGSVAALDDFFSCGAGMALPSSPLSTISEDLLKETTSVALAEQTSSLLQQVQSVTAHAIQMISGLSHDVLMSRPQPDRWSVAECFDHLTRTTEAFLPPIIEAVGTARRLTSHRKLRVGTIAGLLIRTLEPPYRLKHKVLAHLVPQQRDFSATWSNFLNSQAHLFLAVRSTAGLAIDEVKIKSPVCARVTYNAYGALGILTAHQRRHLWQADQVLKDLDRRVA